MALRSLLCLLHCLLYEAKRKKGGLTVCSHLKKKEERICLCKISLCLFVEKWGGGELLI
uniref:Uncharacterized protein n=1 Tax=Anguilla anguilla TaxID=7936 RepID=A0A0E9WJQ5_ANGAN